MLAALIIIGDEILTGRTQDLNGYWLADYLTKVGIELNKIIIVHDSEKEIHHALSSCMQSCDIVFTSGGLGPTRDDITKNVLAKFFDKELISDQESTNLITKLYEKFDRQWTPELNDYHYYPKDFKLTDNLNGFAPGLSFFQNGKALFSAPGVPREFQSMVENIFLPMIKDHFSSDDFHPTQLFAIRTKGIPEERIFKEVCPNLWDQLSSIAKVSSLPHLLGVDIVLYIEQSKFEKKSSDAKKLIEESALAQYVWQYGNLELAEYIVTLCREKNLTVGFAESCTGGLTSSKITDISGSSSIFNGAIVSYANEVKENILGVKRQTLIDHGAVSEQCALEMAIGARKALATDLAISFTGIAGPTGGSEQKPVGTVGIGWSCEKESSSEVLNFRGNRTSLKERFSRAGLFKLLELIMKH
ncbi:nicotinamide-nucleotide amidohydrolase family protein [Halobacteriovorax sp. HLS]|uniref:nicotinamide-nucleotide amidohydrolase family protein n=1 Tax=Halobacteriovorax sp. HLS TaxID=2234000 RepID=UPI000FD8DDF1|nr:nicotinamide-nucleotide amidohydrolase family protein [Halobacteriovorax sp. HLS]